MSSKHQPDEDTRQRLLRAAKQVFSKQGFSGATVKEIADEAGCNVSLISYHFNGKEGIFRTILEEFGRERLRDAEKILSPPDSIEDLRAKLRLWMQQFLLCHVDDDSICSILHRENVLEHDFLWDIFQNTFLKAFDAMVKFFEAARKRGILRKDADPLASASMLFGSLIHVGRNQKIQKKFLNVSIADEKYRSLIIEQFLGILLGGISGSTP
ncbi:MAG TPA: TetR/AcrR family transcriptional regulator [Bdellovibrionota bacterium]|jgi:AcrR family transcriptional regulator